MPFTVDDKWRIMRHLKVGIDQESAIALLLEAVENKSEILVQSTLEIVRQMDAMASEKVKAASGLIKADVLEWKSDRTCSINSYLDQLRHELARSIGYKLERPMPW